MKTLHSRCTSNGKAQGGVGRAAALLPLALLLTSVQAAAQEEIATVLKQQQVDFFYRSSIAVFPCHDLKSRVASIFRALGAREDVEVTVNGCDAVVTPNYDAPDTSQTWQSPSRGWETPSERWQGSSGEWRASANTLNRQRNRYEQRTHIRVRMMLPVEVTPEVLGELEKDKARRELVSRVTGDPAAHLNDPIVFPGKRQRVTLSRKTIGIEPVECELLEQLSTSTFRKLGMRAVARGPRCSGDRVSHIPPEMTVETLMPVMPTAPQLQLAPATGEGGPDPAGSAAPEGESPEPAPPTKPE